MNLPYWFTPGFYGAMLGAVAVTAVGFLWGGWVTSFKAETMASVRAMSEIEAVLLPLCVAQSNADPQHSAKLAQLEDAASAERVDLLMKTGWATVPGTNEPNRILANACISKVSARF